MNVPVSPLNAFVAHSSEVIIATPFGQSSTYSRQASTLGSIGHIPQNRAVSLRNLLIQTLGVEN